ncbi:MAG: ABC transporter substrate-binding protein [Euryarchaeota archaeon]|nr:ABC transporter substrate-binding protein [Euryarchaeota archaeon]
MGVDARLVRAFAVFVAVVTAFILAVPLGGILGIIGGVQAAPPETVLRIGFLQKIDSLNPYIGVNDASFIFYGLVFDAMNVIDNKMEPTPDLATGIWAVPTSDPEMQLTGDPYGSVWQYNLTDKAMWHDGEPFTADDAVFNFNLNAHNFASMWAYQPYSYFMKDAVKIDEQTVRVHFYDRATGDPMPAAYAYLLSIPMLPKHKLEMMDPFTIGFNWTGLFPSEDPPLVGTGPFMATSQLHSEWLAGDHITLVRNPNYHWKYTKAGAPEIKFDKLIMYFYDESTAMTYALENNQLDIAAFPPQAYRNIKSDVASGNLKNITTFDGPKITQYWTEIGINANLAGPNPSRLDKNIRTAMAMATNKSYIVSQYYLGLADEGTTMIPPVNSYWHYEPNATEKIPLDLVAANSMLEAAGYRDIDYDGIRECTASSYAVTQGLVPEGKKLTYDMLVRREYPEEKDIAMYLQDSWRSVGIQLQYRIVDEAQLSSEVYAYQYDTFIWYWSADIDPNYQLFVQTRAAWGGWSDNKWTNATYENNYLKSVTELNKTQRKVYVDNCQRANYLDAHYIILAYPYQTYAWRDDTFSGWGDWAADPGRSMDNFWMGNPLFFDLVPIAGGDAPPVDVGMIALPLPTVPDQDVYFVAFASDVFGDALSFWLDFGDGSWAHESSPGGSSDLQLVEFSHRYMTVGNFTATLWVDDGSGLEGHNVSVELTVVVAAGMPRTVDYLWYDMFNVSFHEWDYTRWAYYKTDEPLTNSYPYLYKSHGMPPGHDIIYSKMRLNITGRDMGELNMASNPEFLPLMGYEQGGTSEIDWYMQYLTSAEVVSRFGSGLISDDGWIASLNGSVTMDEQAAKGVLNLSDSGFDDFAAWWSANSASFTADYADWLIYEAGPDRLDIYPMYDYYLTLMNVSFDAARVGDEIVLSYDLVGWGLEALMTRWLREAFMPTEWYFEDFRMHAVIGNESTDIDIDTGVQYAVYAYTSPETGRPCWAWEAKLQDFIPSDMGHPWSDFDPYWALNHVDRYPGSGTYGQWIPYDYTPGTFDLWFGETLTFEWPAGDQLYLNHSGSGDWGTSNQTGQMIAALVEPNATDMPGQVLVSPSDRTLTFTGMAPFYLWSALQDTHPYLLSEWLRLYELPYGCPYIEFRNGTYTPPVASFTVTPASGPEPTTFSFNASSSSDIETGANDLIVRWDWENDGKWDTSWDPEKVANHSYGRVGTYTAKLEVCDSDGLLGETTKLVTVTDSTAPTTTISLTGKQGSNGWYVSKVNMTLTATDSSSGVARTKYWINGGQQQNYTGPVEIPTEGTFKIGFCSIDNAGNQESNKTTSVKVDTLAPQIEITSRSKFKPGNVTITWTCNDTGSALGLIETGLDGAPLVKRNTSTSITFTDLKTGEHTLRMRATDNAGNVGELTYVFKVESEGISSSAIYAVAGIGIAAVVAVIALLMLRRGKDGQEKAKRP